MVNNEGWGSVLLKESNTFTKGPCYLGQIIVTPKAAKRCDVHVYDSLGSASGEVAHIGTATGKTESISYKKPLTITNGIYVLFDGDTVSVQIVFKARYTEKNKVEEEIIP